MNSKDTKYLSECQSILSEYHGIDFDIRDNTGDTKKAENVDFQNINYKKSVTQLSENQIVNQLNALEAVKNAFPAGISLDNIGNNAAFSKKVFSENSLNLHQLRDEVAKVLPQLPVAYCGKRAYKDYVNIDLSTKGTKHYQNVMHCTSVWTCPICYYRKMVERQSELAAIFRKYAKLGYSFFFVTLTMPHHSNQPLTVLLKELKDNWRAMRKQGNISKLFRQTKKRPGYLYVQTTEIRHGKSYGYHPHYHFVFMVKGKTTIEVNTDMDCLINAWVKKIVHKDIPTQHKLRVDAYKGQKVIEAKDIDTLKDYIYKMNLCNELANGLVKKSAQSMSFFQMAGVHGMTKVMQEYAYATKAYRTINKSRSLKIAKDNQLVKDSKIETLLAIHKLPFYEKVVRAVNLQNLISNVENFDYVKSLFIGYPIDETTKTVKPKTFNNESYNNKATKVYRLRRPEAIGRRNRNSRTTLCKSGIDRYTAKRNDYNGLKQVILQVEL